MKDISELRNAAISELINRPNTELDRRSLHGLYLDMDQVGLILLMPRQYHGPTIVNASICLVDIPGTTGVNFARSRIGRGLLG